MAAGQERRFRNPHAIFILTKLHFREWNNHNANIITCPVPDVKHMRQLCSHGVSKRIVTSSLNPAFSPRRRRIVHRPLENPDGLGLRWQAEYDTAFTPESAILPRRYRAISTHSFMSPVVHPKMIWASQSSALRATSI
jgi:hypothetical protein